MYVECCNVCGVLECMWGVVMHVECCDGCGVL